MRRMCLSQLHLLSRAFITTIIVGFRASSWMVLPVIVTSILDAAPLSLRSTFSVIFQDSQPYSRVDITEAWNRRSLRLFDTLDANSQYVTFQYHLEVDCRMNDIFEEKKKQKAR